MNRESGGSRSLTFSGSRRSPREVRDGDLVARLVIAHGRKGRGSWRELPEAAWEHERFAGSFDSPLLATLPRASLKMTEGEIFAGRKARRAKFGMAIWWR